MDGEDWKFDVIVLGTGLKECILGGLMSSVEKKRVLQVDINDYYGGESASLNLQRLFEQFTDESPDRKTLSAQYGRNSDYNVDLCPKFLMSSGELVNILVKMKITSYLEFKQVAGSYVFNKTLHKVPSTASEGFSSGLLGFTQKIRFRSFINFIAGFKKDDRKTWEGQDVTKKTMADIYKYYKLEKLSQTFVSHALALEPDAKHLSQPALQTIIQIQTYASSFAKFGKSPYIYPHYGLGGLPEAFTRVSAINGGLFMLNTTVQGIETAEDGKVTGVSFLHEGVNDGKAPVTATAPVVIAAPNFVPKSTTKIGQTCKTVFLLAAPVPNTNVEGNCQIILPNTEIKRANDIYVSCLSESQAVCPKQKYLAIMSTTLEGEEVADLTDKKACAAACQRNLAAAKKLIPGNIILKEFSFVTNRVIPAGPNANGLFVTKSMDPTSHFQGATKEVMAIYQEITGHPLDMTV